MALLNITIDTEDLGIDREGYGHSFEDVFHDSLQDQITKRVVGNITSAEVNQYSILVQGHVEKGVTDLLKNLLNEDVAITDGYGRKKFIGSVEDYLKKEIDDKYLHPVDGNGKRLVGCTSSSSTWIQWYLKKQAKLHMDYELKKAVNKIESSISKQIEFITGEFIDEKIKSKVTAKLLEVGVSL